MVPLAAGHVRLVAVGAALVVLVALEDDDVVWLDVDDPEDLGAAVDIAFEVVV